MLQFLAESYNGQVVLTQRFKAVGVFTCHKVVYVFKAPLGQTLHVVMYNSWRRDSQWVYHIQPERLFISHYSLFLFLSLHSHGCMLFLKTQDHHAAATEHAILAQYNLSIWSYSGTAARRRCLPVINFSKKCHWLEQIFHYQLLGKFQAPKSYTHTFIL